MPGTRLIDGRELALDYAAHPRKTIQRLTESLERGHVRPSDFSIRETAVAILGHEAVDAMRPKSGSTATLSRLLEADSVRYTDFSNITGQFLINATLESYKSPDFVFTPLVPKVQTDIQDMEKVPGISDLEDLGTGFEIGEGETYPRLGPSENYIHIARKKKEGVIVEITKEAVRGDLTGQLLEKCKKGGYGLGRWLEKRVIDAMIDENGGAKSAAVGGHRYHWRDTTYASYQTSTPFVNVTTSNGLVNFSNLRTAWQAIMDLRDPFTGEPIVFMPTHLIVCTDNLWTAKNILRSVETRSDTNNSAGTANVVTIFDNPVKNNIPGLEVITSQFLDDRAALDTDWWLGSPAKALARYVVWDLEQEEAPANHHDMFERDIVYKFKSSYMDQVQVVEPRALVENRA